MSASLYFINHEKPESTFLPLSVELNMSNTNASEFLRAIGMNPDFNSAPDFSIGIFEEKLIQFIGNHGPASPVHAAIPENSNGNFVDCGRRENYLIEKAWQAISMTREAKEKHATHGYFA